MSKRPGWKRQSWQDAEAEIGQAVGLTAQPGDQVLQVPDDLVEDSPYQARARYDDAQIADLAQGMAEAGFQGVLFVRPRPDTSRVGPTRYQLAYGHRRRRAWRTVCADRGVPCVLPVIVRQLSDQQVLTIGAQENLQREDLSPLEEAQLVMWHQELYYPAGLGEIGRMLGKSEDWAKTRARVAQLPDPLKDVIRLSPQLMTGALEISRLWEKDIAAAAALAEHALREGLNLKQIRLLVADALGQNNDREIGHDQRVNAPNVNNVTNRGAAASAPESASSVAPTLGARTVNLRTPEQRIEAESERMLSQLKLWEQLVADPAQRDVISRSCERILRQIQQIVGRLAEE
ncbi:MAG: ParB/RepB/Spo0J family partition protein [Chloroflexales bacterium]|nr:ParB/RepB/Spo0J family partition protein [Chloroflexales bacterium]